MKTTSIFYSDDGVFEYEQEIETLFIWNEDRTLVGSIDLSKETMPALINFLTSVQMELL